MTRKYFFLHVIIYFHYVEPFFNIAVIQILLRFA